MKTQRLLPIIIVLFVFACNDKRIDDEKPIIDLSISDVFPVNCDTIYFGEEVSITALFTDNVELGSFSIEIHHNFDHHSHSTEVTECELSPEKDPINPFHFIQDYEIPTGTKEYKTDLKLSIQEKDGSVIYDTGDYHFYINLTDKEGWATKKGLSIKMLHK